MKMSDFERWYRDMKPLFTIKDFERCWEAAQRAEREKALETFNYTLNEIPKIIPNAQIYKETRQTGKVE